MPKTSSKEAENTSENGEEEAVTKLGIGIEGGFKNDEQLWDTAAEYSIYASTNEEKCPFQAMIYQLKFRLVHRQF